MTPILYTRTTFPTPTLVEEIFIHPQLRHTKVPIEHENKEYEEKNHFYSLLGDILNQTIGSLIHPFFKPRNFLLHHEYRPQNEILSLKERSHEIFNLSNDENAR